MYNLNDYALFAGKFPFSSRPFNALDALIFSQIAYLPLEKTPAGQKAVLLRQARELMKSLEPRLPIEFMQKNQMKTLDIIGDSKRYGSLLLSDFINDIKPDINKQFSAVTVHLPGQNTLVAFRGTDLSLTGWQEDFHICFDSPVPAQRQAVEYLRQTAENYPGDIYLCGHSKGGNLAVYAAAFCGEAVQPRIRRIFSFDAPGQVKGVLDTEEYQQIRKRIRSFLPERTLVGVLLNQTRPYTVVACDAFGLMQHNPYRWQIKGGAFVKRKELSAQSQFLDKTVDNWVSAMTRDERQQLTEALFTILESPGEDGFDGLTERWFSNLKTMWSAANQLPKNLKQTTRRAVKLLVSGMFDILTQDVKQTASGIAQGLHQKLGDIINKFNED